MNGHIIAGTGIAVDTWKLQGRKENYVHFLTHLHGDHIVGLTSTWRKKIYCSEFTAMLLEKQYGIGKHYLHVCPINQSIVVPLSNNKTFTVTAFDANHCPGAVMFYFQGEFGNILYTGDFRSSSSIIQLCRSLDSKVDQLYLDNTYCSPACTFPPRDQCLQRIVAIAKEHPDHDIIIGVRGLGKELLLATLGVELNETISVSSKCYAISQMIFQTNVFTAPSLDGQSSRLRTMPMHQISRDFMENVNKQRPTIAIIPTAIYTGLNCEPFSREPKVFIVPYSDHSTYEELVEFVSALKPRRIIPVVKTHRGPFGVSISDRADMSCFNAFLSTNDNIPQDNKDIHEDSMLLTNQDIAHDFDHLEHMWSLHGKEKFWIASKEPALKRTQSNSCTLPQAKRRKHSSIFVQPRGKAKGVIFDDVESDEVELSSGARISSSTLVKNSSTDDNTGTNNASLALTTVNFNPNYHRVSSIQRCGSDKENNSFDDGMDDGDDSEYLIEPVISPSTPYSFSHHCEEVNSDRTETGKKPDSEVETNISGVSNVGLPYWNTHENGQGVDVDQIEQPQVARISQSSCDSGEVRLMDCDSDDQYLTADDQGSCVNSPRVYAHTSDALPCFHDNHKENGSDVKKRRISTEHVEEPGCEVNETDGQSQRLFLSTSEEDSHTVIYTSNHDVREENQVERERNLPHLTEDISNEVSRVPGDCLSPSDADIVSVIDDRCDKNSFGYKGLTSEFTKDIGSDGDKIQSVRRKHHAKTCTSNAFICSHGCDVDDVTCNYQGEEIETVSHSECWSSDSKSVSSSQSHYTGLDDCSTVHLPTLQQVISDVDNIDLPTSHQILGDNDDNVLLPGSHHNVPEDEHFCSVDEQNTEEDTMNISSPGLQHSRNEDETVLFTEPNSRPHNNERTHARVTVIDLALGRNCDSCSQQIVCSKNLKGKILKNSRIHKTVSISDRDFLRCIKQFLERGSKC